MWANVCQLATLEERDYNTIENMGWKTGPRIYNCTMEMMPGADPGFFVKGQEITHSEDNLDKKN